MVIIHFLHFITVFMMMKIMIVRYHNQLHHLWILHLIMNVLSMGLMVLFILLRCLSHQIVFSRILDGCLVFTLLEGKSIILSVQELIEKGWTMGILNKVYFKKGMEIIMLFIIMIIIFYFSCRTDSLIISTINVKIIIVHS